MIIKKLVRPLILKFLVNSFALYLVTVFLKNTLLVEGGVRAFLVAGFVLGFLNFFIKPILKLLSLPFLFFSMGVFMVVINGVVLFLMKYILDFLEIGGITVAVQGGFLNYFLVALVLGVINWILTVLLVK